jgi:uncharacterized protein YpiB (UPF0302 family)
LRNISFKKNLLKGVQVFLVVQAQQNFIKKNLLKGVQVFLVIQDKQNFTKLNKIKTTK